MKTKRKTEMPGRKRENFDRPRIEFVADPEWIRLVANEADRMGLSLSAFIRLAVNEKLQAMGRFPEAKTEKRKEK
jgi:hypothetical protein